MISVKVSFIGLGAMGYPMAGHLSNAGHEVTVFNRSRQRAMDWVRKFGGRSAQTPAAAADESDCVISCVGNDADLREITIGPEGAFGSMRHGAVFVDHTTASAQIARELYDRASSKSFHFLDGPVSGGRLGAENGSLTVMFGGAREAYEAAAPIVSAYAEATTYIGPAGSGQLTKMVNQICLVGIIEGIAEGLHFAKNAQLDIPAVFSAILKGSAQSWQMERHWKPMSESKFDFGFAVEWMRKDLSICLDEARRNGASLPVTALIDNFFSEVEKMGGRRWDTSSLLARLDGHAAAPANGG
jgi:3-hydroxyisobutyrate dehydrogenase